MRYLSLVLSLFFVVLFGCASSSDVLVFETPYGKIHEGSSMVNVMRPLGNPDDINVLPKERAELWYYHFGDDKKIYVYFIDKKVVKVRDTIEEEEKK